MKLNRAKPLRPSLATAASPGLSPRPLELQIFDTRCYAAVPYIHEKRSALHDIAMLPGPQRLQLRGLRQAGPDDFNQALSIFIGEHPVDERLKGGLLGQIQ